ncbi:MAG: hypothetical protein ABSB78_03130 [Bacteroidota bacterium]
MRALILFTVIFAIMFIFLTCKDIPTTPPTGNQIEDISAYLPLKIGNRWIYERISTTEFATIEIRIKDTLRCDDGSLLYSYIEDVIVNNPPPDQPINGYYSYTDGSINQYYIVRDASDTAIIFMSAKFPILKSPIAAGQQWISNASDNPDTIYIGSISSVSVLDTSFAQAVLVVRHNYWRIDSTWFVRGVGIVKQTSVTSTSFRAVSNLKTYYVAK